MAYKTCPDCGSRIFEYGCTWCNEQDYIDMQGIYDIPELKSTTRIALEKDEIKEGVEDKK